MMLDEIPWSRERNTFKPIKNGRLPFITYKYGNHIAIESC